MKGKGWFITLGIATVSAQLIAAERVTFGDQLRYESAIDKFGPNELKLDLFGTYATRDRVGEKGDHWGGGVGLNWFLTDHIGVSVDSYLEELRTPYRANASLLLRLPIETIGMAPYVFGGGGRQWEIVPQWTRHAGIGLDMRMNRHTGFFVDGRRVFPEETDDYTLVRAGFRLGW